jgi:biopolymer transport protein ExbD
MMKLNLRVLFCLFLISSLSLSVSARVDLRKTHKLVLPQDTSEPILSAETSQKILPNKIAEGESGQGVLSKMVDNSLSFWWENSPVKNTSLRQVADKVDKNLRTEVSFGQSADQKTEHKISVKVLAMQALAKIEYKGWVRAALNYDARAAKTEAELMENIATNKDLVVTHSITSIENKSQVSLRWNW